jgi:transposase-like protein
LVGDEPAMREWAAEVVDRARHDGVELTGDNGLLTALVRQVLQTGLEVEMTDHLGSECHAVEGRNTGNSRNGSYPKTVITEVGHVELQVPRDRNASFEAATVPKGQRRMDGLPGSVISLSVNGMTTGDIRAHLAEICDTKSDATHTRTRGGRRRNRVACGRAVPSYRRTQDVAERSRPRALVLSP